MNNEQIKAAREALDSMDDYARMESGVDAAGPRGVLVDFIDLAEAGNPASVATPTAAVAAGTIDTPEFQRLAHAYRRFHTDADYETLVAHIDAAITAASQKAREEGRKEGYEAGRLYEQEIITQEAEEAADRAEAEAVARAERGVCKVPPDGWYCTRVAGHDGPCAAVPMADVQELPALPIKTWQERYELERVYYGHHDERPYMKAEITELRGFLEKKGFS